MVLRRSSLFFIFIFFAWGTGACSASSPTVHVYFVNPDLSRTPEIIAELAVSSGEKQLGLMYRKELAQDRGMLFIFSADAPRQFWMKNTYLELDMLFVNSAREVVSVTQRATPLTETARSSEAPAKYVLEIGGGLAQKWGIRKGSKLIVQESLPTAQD